MSLIIKSTDFQQVRCVMFFWLNLCCVFFSTDITFCIICCLFSSFPTTQEHQMKWPLKPTIFRCIKELREPVIFVAGATDIRRRGIPNVAACHITTGTVVFCGRGGNLFSWPLALEAHQFLSSREFFYHSEPMEGPP